MALTRLIKLMCKKTIWLVIKAAVNIAVLSMRQVEKHIIFFECKTISVWPRFKRATLRLEFGFNSYYPISALRLANVTREYVQFSTVRICNRDTQFFPYQILMNITKCVVYKTVLVQALYPDWNPWLYNEKSCWFSLNCFCSLKSRTSM